MVPGNRRTGGNKRPRLEPDERRLAQAAQEQQVARDGASAATSRLEIASNILAPMRPANKREPAERYIGQQGRFARLAADSGAWSELFDSFKNTNHLKELHCR